MKRLDSRRWPGVNLLMDRPGAVLDVEVDAERSVTLVAAWRRHGTALLEAVGWSGESLHTRVFPGGATLAFTAPIDALYAATEVNECVSQYVDIKKQGKDWFGCCPFHSEKS